MASVKSSLLLVAFFDDFMQHATVSVLIVLLFSLVGLLVALVLLLRVRLVLVVDVIALHG